MHTRTQGKVEAIWRYPIKSLLGEKLEQVEVTTRGLLHDRRFAIQDPAGKLASGKNTRRFFHLEGLFDLSASLEESGHAKIHFPDGSVYPSQAEEIHQRLSEHFGRSLRLVEEEVISHLDEGPIHIVTTHDLAALAKKHGVDAISPCRFRPNLVLSWEGHDLPLKKGDSFCIGSTIFSYSHPTERCRMVTFAQRDIPKDAGLLKSISEGDVVNFGFYVNVEKEGQISVGDQVLFL